MTDEEFSNLEPNKSKVRIKGQELLHIVKAFLYVPTTDLPGYVVLLDNNEYYSSEYLDLVEEIDC